MTESVDIQQRLAETANAYHEALAATYQRQLEFRGAIREAADAGIPKTRIAEISDFSRVTIHKLLGPAG